MSVSNSNIEEKPRKRRRDRHRIRYSLEYASARALTFVLCLLPQSVVERMGRTVGAIAYRFLGKRKSVARKNLDLAFGDSLSAEDKDTIILKMMKNFGAWFAEFMTFGKLSQDEIMAQVDVSDEDRQQFFAAVSQNKGVILLVSHFCRWELLGLYLGCIREVQKAVVVKAMHNPWMDRWINRVRSQAGSEIIYSHQANFKILRALRRGKVVAIVYDQDTSLDRGGVYTTFFGQECVTTRSVATYSLAAGSPILSVWCLPLDNGRIRIQLSPIGNFTPSGDDQQDIQALTQQCNDQVETYIRENPEYYFWLHKRWKHRPPACPPVYD